MRSPVTHKELGGRPPIYCFVWDRIRLPGSVVVVAMSQAGTILAAEQAPSEHQARVRIGLGSVRNHDRYTAEYPNGYVLMWLEDGLRNQEVQNILEMNRRVDMIVDHAARNMEEK